MSKDNENKTLGAAKSLGVGEIVPELYKDAISPAGKNKKKGVIFIFSFKVELKERNIWL